MKIICIAGKARHGKDTVAGIMKNHLEASGHSVLITHFADLLKYICEKFFNWDGKKNEYGRTLLQYIGTNVVRENNPNFWVDFIKTVLTFSPDNWDYVLIPDCRFPNEINCFKDEYPTYSIKVVRPNFDSGLEPHQINHPSETALDDFRFDFYLENNGSLNALDSNVMQITQIIEKER